MSKQVQSIRAFFVGLYVWLFYGWEMRRALVAAVRSQETHDRFTRNRASFREYVDARQERELATMRLRQRIGGVMSKLTD